LHAPVVCTSRPEADGKQCVSPKQAHEAVDAARASLGRYEAALAARGAKLADSWRLMREAADRLLSGDRPAPSPGLEVLTCRACKPHACMYMQCSALLGVMGAVRPTWKEHSNQGGSVWAKGHALAIPW
jgi:hypothetical protein